jgi:hypothetical protein
MYHVARVHTTWASSIDPSSRVIESYVTRYALQLTALIPHHVQPRSRGTMTRSSPFPRRFYEDSHSKSQQHDTHTDSTHYPANGLSLSQKEKNLFSGSKREREKTQHNTIFLGAYDNLLERETHTRVTAEMQRTHKGFFLEVQLYKSYHFSEKKGKVIDGGRERERERPTDTETSCTLPRREILLCSPWLDKG